MSKKKDGFELLDMLQSQAAEQREMLYNILYRNAGWGIQWFDAKRVETPLYTPQANHDLNQQQEMRMATQIQQQKEGLIIHGHHPTLRDCVKAEMSRLKKQLKPEKESPA